MSLQTWDQFYPIRPIQSQLLPVVRMAGRTLWTWQLLDREVKPDEMTQPHGGFVDDRSLCQRCNEIFCSKAWSTAVHPTAKVHGTTVPWPKSLVPSRLLFNSTFSVDRKKNSLPPDTPSISSSEKKQLHHKYRDRGDLATTHRTSRPSSK